LIVGLWAAAHAAEVQPEVVVERARLALEWGQGALARAAVDDAFGEEFPADVERGLHEVYLASAAMDGLLVQARAAYEVLSVDDPAARLAWTAHQVSREGRPLRDLVLEGSDDLVFGWAAFARKEYTLAAVAARRVDSPDAFALRLEAEMRLGNTSEALAQGAELLRRWPDRPDALLGLWSDRWPSPSVARARQRLLAASLHHGRRSESAAVAYRALRLAEHAHDGKSEDFLKARLTSFGETLPERSRVDADPFGALERQANDLLASDLHMGAMHVAEQANVLAVRPAPGDRSRVDARRLARELASAQAIRGAAAAGLKERSASLVAITLAAVLDGATWEPARRRWRREPVPEAVVDRAAQAALSASSIAEVDEALALCASIERPDSAPSRARIAALLERNGALRRERGEDDAALADYTLAALVEPSASRHRTRADLYEKNRELDAAFLAFALAQAYGASGMEAALERTWTGPGAWEPVAVAAVEAFQAGLPAGSIPREGDGRPRMGEPVPEFSLETPSGRKSVADFRGRVVVVTLWASWCGPCITELTAFGDLARRLASEGAAVEVIAVSVDERMLDYERVRRRPGFDGITFSWNPELGSRFDVNGIPSSWVVDAQGRVRFHHVGFAPGDERLLEREIRSLVE
jgi:thiol-disulfide isomerase/thioredoxin